MYCKISSGGGLMIQSWCEMTRLCSGGVCCNHFNFTCDQHDLLWTHQCISQSWTAARCCSAVTVEVAKDLVYLVHICIDIPCIHTVYLHGVSTVYIYTVYLCANSVSIRHSPTAQRSVAHRPSPSPHPHTTQPNTVNMNNAIKHQNYFHRKIFLFNKCYLNFLVRRSIIHCLLSLCFPVSIIVKSPESIQCNWHFRLSLR